MATLFSIHLSRSVAAMPGKPSSKSLIPSKPPEKCLFMTHALIAEERPIPDRDSLRDVLPSFYKRAFDRAYMGKISEEDIYYFRLHGSRGQYLNTVYCYRYEFN